MTLPLRTSRSGLEFIKSFEGFRARAARLPDGRWTIGHGHVRSAREGVRITPADAESLLIYDLQKIEEEIEPLILTPLNANQFDALASFAYNISPGLFRECEVLRRLNAGDHLGAARAMDSWCNVRISGRLTRVDALVRRRAAEAALFLAPPAGPIPAPTPFYPPEPDLSRNGAAAPEMDVANAAPEPPDVGGDVGSLRDAIKAMADRQREEASPTAAQPISPPASPLVSPPASPAAGPESPESPEANESRPRGEPLKTPRDVAAQMRARINRVLEREEAAVATREQASRTSTPVAVQRPAEDEPRDTGDAFSLSGSMGDENGHDIAARLERALNGDTAAEAPKASVPKGRPEPVKASLSAPEDDFEPEDDDAPPDRRIIDDTITIPLPPAHRWSIDDAQQQASRIPWRWITPLVAGVGLGGWGVFRLLSPSSAVDAPAADTLSPTLLLAGGLLIAMAIYFLLSRRRKD